MADYGIRRYRLGKARLSRALLQGFELVENSLRTQARTGSASAFLPGLDSAAAGCLWGRLTLRCSLGPESMLTVRAFASDQDVVRRGDELVKIDQLLTDPQVPLREKERLFLLADGLERSGVRDVLLNGQTGRWLWLWLEVTGEEGCTLEDLRVYVPGDHFFRTFPQVYQTDNDFFQRYISVFSTMYQELQEKIDDLPGLLDVDTAPEKLLPVFASWLGLETDERLFSAQELRELVKAAPELMARKGTKWAVERVVGLLVQGPIYVVERNLLSRTPERGEELYGSTPYDFTVMLSCPQDEKLRARLQFLVDQFRPVRSRCRIVFLEECGGLDAFTYLDINGSVLQNTPGSLDDRKALTGMIYLE